nr:unnamed protein product [Callosobruchus chinensis]
MKSSRHQSNSRMWPIGALLLQLHLGLYRRLQMQLCYPLVALAIRRCSADGSLTFILHTRLRTINLFKIN